MLRYCARESPPRYVSRATLVILKILSNERQPTLGLIGGPSVPLRWVRRIWMLPIGSRNKLIEEIILYGLRGRESLPIEEFDRMDGHVGQILAEPGIVGYARERRHKRRSKSLYHR